MKVKIKTNNQGLCTTFEVIDEDNNIVLSADKVLSYKIEHKAGELPRLTVVMNIRELDIEAENTDIDKIK